MLRVLVLALDLFSSQEAVESLVRDVLTFGLANAAIAFFFASFAIVHRRIARRIAEEPSRAQGFKET
jgi:hypothetical protein